MELIRSETCDLIHFLEITSKVLLVGLMVRPDEAIHEEMVSTSCCSRALSLLEEMHLWIRISSAYKMMDVSGESSRSASELI